jgi:tricorn protease
MDRHVRAPRLVVLCLAIAGVTTLRSAPVGAQATALGYFRQPALWNETLVFTAEGDLWRVPIAGGVPERLTSHPGQETNATISADGRNVVFSGTYEGPRELYQLPLTGGAPRRLTWIGGSAVAVGWTREGQLLYSTDRSSTLPNDQLFSLDTTTLARAAVPLWQARDGAYAGDGTLFFTRLPFQGATRADTRAERPRRSGSSLRARAKRRW